MNSIYTQYHLLSPRKFKRFPTLRSYDFPLFLSPPYENILYIVTKSFARMRSTRKKVCIAIYFSSNAFKRHFNFEGAKKKSSRQKRNH